MATEHEAQLNKVDDNVTRAGSVVYESELEEIVHRRKIALDQDESRQKIRQNLVGLALSGGGVRSAAISLGILQSFYSRRILPFIDYLSTVSGGGYAGAYLSSAALKAGRQRNQRGADSSDVDERAADSNEDDVDPLFPIARKATGGSSARMWQFIHGGDYLKRTWVFFNRYLIGLMMIWAVVISGVVAATSLAAWLFRCLDHTQPRAWATALGFDRDVKLAFLPSFVLLFLWFFLWALSYLKFGARSTGFFARGVFYLLVTVTLVAIAALLGNGEYGLTSTEAAPASTFSKVIYSVILTAVIAALLPYLSPKRLVQSGTAPKNAVERYVFWLATRALAYGVPFILVAYFARENISSWNERRDDRLTRMGVSFALDSPLWRQVAHELPLQMPNLHKVLLPDSPVASSSATLEEKEKNEKALKDTFERVYTGTKTFNVWREELTEFYSKATDLAKSDPDRANIDAIRETNLKLLKAYFGSYERGPRSGNTWPENQEEAERPADDLPELAKLFRKLHMASLKGKLADSELDELRQLENLRGWGESLDLGEAKKRKPTLMDIERERLIMPRKDFVVWFKENVGSVPPDLEADADPDEFARDWDEIQAHLTESQPLNDPTSDTAISFPARWWHLLQYFGERFSGSQKSQENVVYQMANSYVQQREIKWHIVRLLNERLRDELFYQSLLPAALFKAPTGVDAQNTQPKENAGKGVRPPLSESPELADAFWDVARYHDTFPEQSVGAEKKTDEPDDAKKRWIENLHSLRMEAERWATQLKKQKAMDKDFQQDDLQGERVDDIEFISHSDRERATIALNRKLLTAYFGNLIEDKDIVYSSVVLAEDQRVRFRWFLYSFGLFVIACLCVDMNATSLHGFYSTQIGKAWIEEVPGLGRAIPLAQLETTDVGRPYHLISGSLHVIGKRKNRATAGREDFLFSKLYCGSSRLAYEQTPQYMKGEYALDDAIAVSGSAVSPVQTTNPLVMALLVLFNVRTGQWVANPACEHCSTRFGRFFSSKWPVTPFRILLSLFRAHENRPLCFITDGGHHENLGIEPLLARRCRLIIAMDASQDGDYKFDDLARLIRWSRLRHGIRFERSDEPNEPIDLRPLIPRQLADEIDVTGDHDKEKSALESKLVTAVETIRETTQPKSLRWSERHFLVLKIRYPETSEFEAGDGYLVYMKSTLTGDEPMDLQQFKRSEPEFPHNPTADQFYDRDRFEAYTQLGYHIGQSVGEGVREEFLEAAVDPVEFIRKLTGADVTAAQAPRRRKKPVPHQLKPTETSRKSTRLDELIEQLRSGNKSDQLKAAIQFEKLDDTFLCLTPQLLKAWFAEAEDNDLCPPAIREFFINRADAAFDEVRRAVSHVEADVRRAAIQCLSVFVATGSYVDSDAAIDLILQGLRDEVPAVSKTASDELEDLLTKDRLGQRKAETEAALRGAQKV